MSAHPTPPSSRAPPSAVVAACRLELRRIPIIKRLVASTVKGTLGEYEQFRVFNFNMYRSTLQRILRGNETLTQLLVRHGLQLDSPLLDLSYVQGARAPHYYEAGELVSYLDRRGGGNGVFIAFVARHISHDPIRCTRCRMETADTVDYCTKLCKMCRLQAHEPCAVAPDQCTIICSECEYRDMWGQ